MLASPPTGKLEKMETFGEKQMGELLRLTASVDDKVEQETDFLFVFLFIIQ